jgi:CxxC motif-containing protein
MPHISQDGELSRSPSNRMVSDMANDVRFESGADAESGRASDVPGAVEVRTFTCVTCPSGCTLEVKLVDGAVVDVTGNTCKRGEEYGRNEATNPKRVLTMLVDVRGSEMPVSCKTAEAVPKRLIPDCIETLRGVTLDPPVRIGDVIVSDICGTGVDVVATKNV